ncbi:MAG: DUF4956 domain-containing protein [Proteobacteria bacterium]|nr:DUF4956 domain-containing protein [Pseudomonadota bacterium]
MAELFGMEHIFDATDFSRLVVRMAFNLFFVWLVIRLVYLRLHARRDFAFSCVMLNIITFAICVLLRKVPVDLGFALGLFAVFGVLRYRTEAIAVRDLTYLFIVLGLAILNAVANKKVSVAELAFINSAIVGLTAVLEYLPFSTKADSRLVVFDKLELLQPGREDELRADLRDRLGIDLLDYRVNSIDLLRDTAELLVTGGCHERRRAGSSRPGGQSAATRDAGRAKP